MFDYFSSKAMNCIGHVGELNGFINTSIFSYYYADYAKGRISGILNFKHNLINKSYYLRVLDVLYLCLALLISST